MNLWKTLTLLLVFVGLLVWSLKNERGEQPDFEANRTVVQLLDFRDKSAIVEISIEGGEQPITLRRSTTASAAEPKAAGEKADKPGDSPANEETWEITSPIQAKGDATSIKSYVDLLLTTKAQKSYTAEDAKRMPDSASGLDKPTRSLTLKDQSGRVATMTFGFQTPDKQGYFARVKNGVGMLIFANFFVDENLVKKKLGDLRDKALLAFLTSDVQTVELKYPSRSVQLAKRGEDWFLAGKPELQADSAAVDSLLSAVSTARIDEFGEAKPTDLKLYGLDQPRVTVTLGMGQKGEVGLVVGSSKMVEAPPPSDPNQPPPQPTEKLHVQRKGNAEVLLVAGTLYDNLLKQPTDLRDKVVFAVKGEDVTKLEYTVGGSEVVLQKTAAAKNQRDSKAQWQVVKPAALTADRKLGDGLAATLEQLRATAFHDAPKPLASYGLDRPQARILVTEADKVLPALLVGRKTADGSSLYVKRENAPLVYEVRASFVDDFVTDLNRLRDRLVLGIDRTRVKSIDFRHQDNTWVTVTATGADSWEYLDHSAAPAEAAKDAKESKPEAKKADSGRVAAVLTALEDLRCSHWLSDKIDPRTLGFERPDLTVTVNLDGGAKETVYLVRDPANPTAIYVKRKGWDTVYRNENDTFFLDLQKRGTDFEPLPAPDMGGMPGMGGPPPM
ncbi:MAG: DUF4340 domain-containing protein [Fimbriimonadaceae bacterium]|nr:DUF4340 domain-containing protein [Fimbriimonadaceae bacterium]